MTVGMCSCEVGKDGSPCRHQFILWSANVAHCINFVPVAQPQVRQQLAWIAIGDSLPLSCYKNLRTQDDQNQESSEVHVPTMQVTQNPSPEVPDQVVVSEVNSDESQDECIVSATDLLRQSCALIAGKLESTRDPNLAKGISKFSKRVMSLAAATAMHSNLTSALFNFGSSEMNKNGKGKKIKVQPNRKRKSGNGSRQAVSKGRPTEMQRSLAVPPKRAKRSHDLAKAVLSNTQGSKKSGSHAMKSKSRHNQRKQQKVKSDS